MSEFLMACDVIKNHVRDAERVNPCKPTLLVAACEFRLAMPCKPSGSATGTRVLNQKSSSPSISAA